MIFWKLGPFLNFQRKPHVRETFGSWNNEPGVTPIDAFFAISSHIEWTISRKVHIWSKWFFGSWKSYLRATYPDKRSHRASLVHHIWLPRFLHFLNDPKWISVNISSLECQIDLILHIVLVLNLLKQLKTISLLLIPGFALLLLGYALPCFAMVCYGLLCFCYLLLWFAMLCLAKLCYAVLCCALLCVALFCFAFLCFTLVSSTF